MKRVRVFYRSSSVTIARELTARNALALHRFRERWAQRNSPGARFIDPCSPAWRVRLDAWFDAKRAFARRWLFKRRCEKRAIARLYRMQGRARDRGGR